jgi:ankyrin repeat protein
MAVEENMPIVLEMLELGATAETATGRRPIIMAVANAKKYQKDVFDALVQVGMNVHEVNDQGENALFYCRTIATCKRLLDEGVDITKIANSGHSCLSGYRENSSGKIIQFLLKNGVEPNEEDIKKCSDLTSLIESGIHISRFWHYHWNTPSTWFMRDLLKNGADVNSDVGNGTTLHYPRDPSLMMVLLNHNPDLSATNLEGNTPLHMYVARSDKFACKVVQRMVELGADVNALNHAGQTPVDIAIARSALSKRCLLRLGGVPASELENE